MAPALIRHLAVGLLALAGGAAEAQRLDTPRQVAGAPAAASGSLDAAAMPMLGMPSTQGTFQEWYAANQRPGLVVYFDKKLAHVPPGWRGTSRLVIEDSNIADGKEKNRLVTIGVEHNTDAVAVRKSQFAALFEQAVQQELKRQNFRLLDSSVVQRRQASSHGADGDIEYAALRDAAGFVFEVALLGMGGEWELVGELKDLESGELTATVRFRIDGPLATPADLDRASRALVQRLLRSPVS